MCSALADTKDMRLPLLRRLGDRRQDFQTRALCMACNIRCGDRGSCAVPGVGVFALSKTDLICVLILTARPACAWAVLPFDRFTREDYCEAVGRSCFAEDRA